MKILIKILLTITVLIRFNIGAKTVESRKQNSANMITTDYSFLNEYNTVNVPMLDTTNFDNHRITNLLTQKQITLLSLNKVIKMQLSSDKEIKIGVNYLLDLSTEFKTIVFYYYPNEHEVYSVLVNYDSEFKMIDFKTIAMDEIAENFLRTESLIEKNSITISNYKFFNETIEEIEIVDINEDGKLKTRR